MRSMLDLSSRREAVSNLADWVEAGTLFRDDRSVSNEDLVRALVREDIGDGDEEYEEDLPATKAGDAARLTASRVFMELGDRQNAIGREQDSSLVPAYPFELDGDVLRLRADPGDCSQTELLYLFLLAVTRASMESISRSLAGINPTLLFERLCGDVLREFWKGGDAFSDSFIVGTSHHASERRRFPQLIGDLCERLREGGGWKDGARSPRAGDGGLDLVVWRRFSDRRPGSLVGFAQCKTGDHWRDHLGRHNPRSVCGRFLRQSLAIDPIAIYMVPCRVDREDWENSLREHRGLLFDRVRIAQYGVSVSDESIRQCRRWFEAAVSRERTDLHKRMGFSTGRAGRGRSR